MEDQKFVGMQNTFTDYINEIGHTERVFVELIEFIEVSSEAQLLLKITDVSEFIRRSFD